MRIVFNSNSPHSPAYIFYRSGFQYSPEFEMMDFSNYLNYDVALFMGFETDLPLMIEAKKQNSKLLIGLVDPRGDHIESFADFFDFLVVDSLEMIDFFSRFRKPIFKYYEYFDVAVKPPCATKGEKIIIGYHGNQIHLMGMGLGISQALDLLYADFPNIEFWALYNISNLGKWSIGLPSKIPVRHIQFNESTFAEEIARMDIGITPAMLPFANEKKIRASKFGFRKILNHSESDYCFRFKMLTNIGRLIVFARLGVPVVSDMYPSAVEVIKHGHNGFLASSTAGWYNCLATLIKDGDSRTRLARNMQSSILELVDYNIQNRHFLEFLSQQKPNHFQKPLSSAHIHEFSDFSLSVQALKKMVLLIMRKLRGWK